VLRSEYTWWILSTPAQFWLHWLNSEYTCSILSTPAQFWVHLLTSEYTCSLLSTPAQFWLHVLNSDYTCSILSTRVQFWVHVLNSSFPSAMRKSVKVWSGEPGGYVICLQIQVHFSGKAAVNHCRIFSHIVLEFLRATTITSTNLNNQGILDHFLAKEQEFTLFQRFQASKGTIQTLGQ